MPSTSAAHCCTLHGSKGELIASWRRSLDGILQRHGSGGGSLALSRREGHEEGESLVEAHIVLLAVVDLGRERGRGGRRRKESQRNSADQG